MYSKEQVHESDNDINRRHLSAKEIEAKTFAMAKVKQGGYGFCGEDFWLWRIPNRGFHVFLLTLSGKGRIVMEDGNEIILKPGQAFISAASGQGHYEATIGPEHWEMVWITFWEDSNVFIPSCDDYEVREFMSTEPLKENMLSIFREALYQDSRSDDALDLYEQLFLINLNRGIGDNEDKTMHKHRLEFVKLWEKVASDLSRPWNIRDLCRETGYSRTHLTRLCLELYELNPGQIVRNMKMKQAKVLLVNSVQSVEAIASMLGFSRLSAFSYAFKEYYGLSPREFRNTSSQKTQLKHFYRQEG